LGSIEDYDAIQEAVLCAPHHIMIAVFGKMRRSEDFIAVSPVFVSLYIDLKMLVVLRLRGFW